MNTSFFGDMLQTIAERGRALIARTRDRREVAEQRSASLVQLCDALLSGRGEASGVALAREILTRYAELKTGSRIAFFEALAKGYGPDRARLNAAATAWLRGCGPAWGPVLLALPWLALRGRHTDAARLLAEGAFTAAWIALVPWLACVLPALAPWALRAAVGAERALSPHVWQERRHLPGGDPLAWDEGGAG